ncbi:MAG: DMT family transporter [Acidimicrobiia bacterium]|nr:DMT family transporter [Acidimicrobiia bacterium]
MRRPRVAYVALAFAAFLFGSTFVVIKDAVTYLPPLGFVGWRFSLGAAVLVVLAPPRGRRLWREGAIAGSLLFAGYALQTVGLAHTSASNSGLITGLYVVFTPLLAALVARRAPRLLVFFGALLAFGGLALLTLEDGLSLQRGDALTVGCAVAYAFHIVYLSRVALRHRVIPFTAVQLIVVAAGGLASAAVFEGFRFPPARVWPALVLTGIAVSAGAFFLQVWSQTVIGPSRTAIILALEPAFAAATAAVVLGERLTPAGWVGAALILAGIYLALVGEEDPLPRAEALTPAH